MRSLDLTSRIQQESPKSSPPLFGSLKRIVAPVLGFGLLADPVLAAATLGSSAAQPKPSHEAINSHPNTSNLKTILKGRLGFEPTDQQCQKFEDILVRYGDVLLLPALSFTTPRIEQAKFNLLFSSESGMSFFMQLFRAENGSEIDRASRFPYDLDAKDKAKLKSIFYSDDGERKARAAYALSYLGDERSLDFALDLLSSAPFKSRWESAICNSIIWNFAGKLNEGPALDRLRDLLNSENTDQVYGALLYFGYSRDVQDNFFNLIRHSNPLVRSYCYKEIQALTMEVDPDYIQNHIGPAIEDSGFYLSLSDIMWPKVVRALIDDINSGSSTSGEALESLLQIWAIFAEQPNLPMVITEDEVKDLIHDAHLSATIFSKSTEIRVGYTTRVADLLAKVGETEFFDTLENQPENIDMSTAALRSRVLTYLTLTKVGRSSDPANFLAAMAELAKDQKGCGGCGGGGNMDYLFEVAKKEIVHSSKLSVAGLLANINSNKPRERELAVAALAAVPGPISEELIIARLLDQSEDIAVRVAAASGLGKRFSTEAERALIESIDEMAERLADLSIAREGEKVDRYMELGYESARSLGNNLEQLQDKDAILSRLLPINYPVIVADTTQQNEVWSKQLKSEALRALAAYTLEVAASRAQSFSEEELLSLKLSAETKYVLPKVVGADGIEIQLPKPIFHDQPLCGTVFAWPEPQHRARITLNALRKQAGIPTPPKVISFSGEERTKLLEKVESAVLQGKATYAARTAADDLADKVDLAHDIEARGALHSLLFLAALSGESDYARSVSRDLTGKVDQDINSLLTASERAEIFKRLLAIESTESDSDTEDDSDLERDRRDHLKGYLECLSLVSNHFY